MMENIDIPLELPSLDDIRRQGEERRQMEDEAASLADPDGVRYMYQLHKLILRQDGPLQVVLRVDETDFKGVPVRAWWSRGRYDYEDRRVWRSSLRFDLPDVVCRHIQQSYAGKLARIFFGAEPQHDLPAAIRPDTDEERTGYLNGGWVKHQRLLQSEDWSRLCRAVAETAVNRNHKIPICGFNGTAKALVGNGMIQLHVGFAVPQIQALWTEAYRTAIGATDAIGRIGKIG